MSLNFRTVKIGDVGHVVSGSTPRTGVSEFWDGGNIAWLTPTDLKEDTQYVTSSERMVTRAGFDSANLTLVPAGTVLLTSRAPIGKVAIAGTELCTNQGFKNIVCSDEILSKYLYYYLRNKTEFLNHLGRGATFKEISKTIVEQVEVPLPSLEYQRKIVDALDKAQELIDKRKQQMGLLDDLLQSVFLDTVGPGSRDYDQWIKMPVEDLASSKKGSMRTGPYGSDLLVSEFVDGGISVLGIDNAVDNTFAWKEMRYITHEKYEQLKRYTVYPGDVIVTIMGTTGRSAVIPDDIPVAISTKHLATITVDESKVLPHFLSFCIHSHPYVLEQIRRENQGAIMGGLNLTKIRKLEIPVPPLGVQARFVNVLKKTDRQCRLFQTSLLEMQNLFNSIMQRAFKGELFS